MKYLAPLILIPVGFASALFQVWQWLLVPGAAAFLVVYIGLCLITLRFKLPDEDAWYFFFMLAIVLGAIASLIFPEFSAEDPLFTAHGIGMKIGGALFAIFGGVVAIASYPAVVPKRQILDEPVTIETFYIAEPHLYEEESEYVFPPGVTEEKIAEAEERLRILLPRRLCDLYKRQNGGYAPRLCYERADGQHHDPFPSDILPPLSGLESLADHIESAFEFAENKSSLSSQDAKMVVLDAVDSDVLVLKAEGRGEAAVGHLTLDEETGAIIDAFWWPDFETFFASLRRYIWI